MVTVDLERGSYGLDCYPYTFSPLLLFNGGEYFDKGHSNYNAVAKFFEPTLKDEIDMLENVLYDSKNMLYEELLEHVTKNQMLVTCCIDSHFTAFQILPKKALLYYDPLSAQLKYMSGRQYDDFVIFMLLKCNYGDSQHIQETKTTTRVTNRGLQYAAKSTRHGEMSTKRSRICSVSARRK